MKKLLGILVLGVLLIPNYSEAKTKDIGQGLTINIPNNYEYFEITLGEIYSEFPEIDNGDDTLKSLGIGDKTKFVVIAKNKKSIKLFKEFSNSEGFEKLKEEYWEPLMELIQGEEFVKLLEKEFKKMGKDPNKMSQKKIEATIMKISQKPSFQKKIEKLIGDHPAMSKFEKEYPLDRVTMLLIGDKKIESELAKTLEMTSPSEIKKNIKDFIKELAKEDPSLKDFKKWKFQIRKNYNGNLYLYSDDQIPDPYTKTITGFTEVFLSTNNEKFFFVLGTCSKNCKKTDLLEVITPTNLLVKTSEKIEIENNNNISQQLKDLNELYKSGALTKEEFEKAKKKLLN